MHRRPDIDTALGEVRRVLAPGGRFVAIERHIADGTHGLASHGWTRAQADAFAARCDTFGLPATVGEHADGNRAPALSVVALAPSNCDRKSTSRTCDANVPLWRRGTRAIAAVDGAIMSDG